MTAMDRALDAIASIPSPWSPESFKRRVRSIMRAGERHPFVWSRFEHLVEEVRDRDRAHCLAAARLYIELEYRAEVEARRIAIANWGRCSRPRLTVNVLQEARLILRWLQRHAADDYAQIRDAILHPQFSEAAE